MARKCDVSVDWLVNCFLYFYYAYLYKIWQAYHTCNLTYFIDILFVY